MALPMNVKSLFKIPEAGAGFGDCETMLTVFQIKNLGDVRYTLARTLLVPTGFQKWEQWQSALTFPPPYHETQRNPLQIMRQIFRVLEELRRLIENCQQSQPCFHTNPHSIQKRRNNPPKQITKPRLLYPHSLPQPRDYIP